MTVKMTAKKREQDVPHSNLTNLRAAGEVPGVLYGYNTESTSVAVAEVDLIKTLRESGRNGVITLDVDGKSYNVVLSDYQRDALKGNFKHVDFLAINMTEELEVEAAVHLIGDAPGEKEGGTVTQPNRELTIRVKPSDIPDAVEIDVSELAIGDSLTVGDVRSKVPYEILDEDDFTLVTITAPRTQEEMDELDAVTDEGAEPEVVGGAKEDE